MHRIPTFLFSLIPFACLCHAVSGPVAINGKDSVVIHGQHISSTTGDCLTVQNSTNVTIEGSEIGPCAGRAITIIGGSNVNIFDSYVHAESVATACCDLHDAIYASQTSNLLIQGNVIAYGEANVEVEDGTFVYAIGNFMLNPGGPFPRGQNFQCWGCSYVTVSNNYTLSSRDAVKYLHPDAQEDSLNVGQTTTFWIQNNFISGGHNPSGCGIMADTYSNYGQILGNLLLDTGQCGIGVADGTHTVSYNKVLNRNPIEGGGNTAIYVAHFGRSGVCGPITLQMNYADEVRGDGFHSGWWNAHDCGTIELSTNVFGREADKLLDQKQTVFTTPLIPPQPKSCVVKSPYTTQTSGPACQ